MQKSQRGLHTTIHMSAQDKAFCMINTIILLIVLAVIAYPIYFVIIASVSDPDAVNAGRVLAAPKDISFIGYSKVLSNVEIKLGALNTALYTLAGTAMNVFFTVTGAYALSIRFPGRKVFMGFMMFTMYFSGGMVPNYLIYRDLGIVNTRWAMLLPGLISVYNLIITRTYIESNISKEMFEAAQIDGCRYTRFLYTMVWPLSGSIVAVIALYYGVGHWNDYMKAILYLRDRKLFPLQLVLREVLILNQVSAAEMYSISDIEQMSNLQRVADSMKYSLIIITSIPMMAVYPFIQKFFVKGVMIGSVKG